MLVALHLTWITLCPAASPDDTALREALDRHCVRCHKPPRPKGQIDLTRTFTFDDEAMWVQALQAVEQQRMPPKRGLTLDDDGRAALVALLKTALTPDEGVATTAGRPTLRRLDRTEYDRTVRDLLDVRYDSSQTFPSEATAHGFENVGDVQFITPMLFEKYHEATSVVVERALRERTLLDAATNAVDDRTTEVFITSFLRRAFRRPPTHDEVQRRVHLLQAQPTVTEGLRDALGATLLSPHFLFRIEGASETSTLTAHEVATRLSYFLTSTMPDDALGELADAGTLLAPDVLEAEARRLLAAPDSDALVHHFASRWLGFAGILEHAVDFRRFRGFDDRLKRAMYDETAHLIDDVVHDRRSVFDLLDCGETWLNEQLAKHYGIDGVTGREMRVVALPDGQRGGLLGMASILTMTSEPLRTSPVKRGAWLLDTLLGTPPPPPPPGAGELPEDDEQKDGLTLRQRLERHRADPSCAACHATIDPWGLALEPFDGVGRWRTEQHGKPIDPVSTLPDGTVLRGVEDVKRALLARRPAFARACAERLFIYAIGRSPRLADGPLLETLGQELERTGTFSTLVLGIVRSRPFLERDQG